MYKITFPRTGYDGKTYTQKDIEDYYVSKVHDKILKALNEIGAKLSKRDKKKQNFINHLTSGTTLKDLLLVKPQDMQRTITSLEAIAPKLTRKSKGKSQAIVLTPFGRKIYKAFNYDNFRNSILVQLAKKLNVKSCPYCNHQYTLYVYKATTTTTPVKHQSFAKFQFDHFLSKSKYPYLSMSLYNLIPSCSVCNQGKSDKDIDIKFNPYLNDTGSGFKFRLKNTDVAYLFAGGVIKDDIDINLTATGTSFTQQEIDEYELKFSIKAQYARHRDIVQEIYDKTYLEPYFADASNFGFLHNPNTQMRLLLGNYEDKKDIEKRPFAKFTQDLWEQLLAVPKIP